MNRRTAVAAKVGSIGSRYSGRRISSGRVARTPLRHIGRARGLSSPPMAHVARLCALGRSLGAPRPSASRPTGQGAPAPAARKGKRNRKKDKKQPQQKQKEGEGEAGAQGDVAAAAAAAAAHVRAVDSAYLSVDEPDELL